MMLNAETLKGNWGTLLLPISADNSLDLPLLSAELDALIAAHVDGIYSNGTAGEFHNQTEDEFDTVQNLMAEKCRAANMPFQIGVSHPSPIVSLERIKRTASLTPSAFQLILPDWVPLHKDERISFLEKMAATAGDIPLVLYNPPHAKSVLAPADLQHLQQNIPSLIGIKTGAGDGPWYEDMRSRKLRLSIFVPGHFLATGVKEGVASGAYSNVACLSPHGAQKWWESMSSDLPAALELESRIHNFFQQCIVPYKNAGFSNPALDKFLAAIGGWTPIGTRLRWPYRFIDEKESRQARILAQKLLPEFF